jgi:glucose-6-phosphate 1-epimerase
MVWRHYTTAFGKFMEDSHNPIFASDLLKRQLSISGNPTTLKSSSDTFLPISTITQVRNHRMTSVSLAELNRRFAIPGTAEFSEGNGGLVKVQVTCGVATGEMYLHGAHVTAWKSPGFADALFVSPHSHWQDGVAIRGGVPICFPWFGDKAGDPHAPAHGFVRTKAWQVESVLRIGDDVSVSMFTESDEGSRKWWPADFRLVHRVTFGAVLTLELVVTNTGKAGLRFEEAMHAYYSVGDAREARVAGLNGVSYLDKTDGFKKKVQSGDVVIAAETDRVYLDTSHALALSDPVLRHKIEIAKHNSRSTVIWNPWVEKAAEMGDLGVDEWKRMLCIEVTNVGDYAIELAPGQQHVMKATVRMESSRG